MSNGKKIVRSQRATSSVSLHAETETYGHLPEQDVERCTPNCRKLVFPGMRGEREWAAWGP